MKRETILYISDHATSSNSVTVELEAKGYEVVGTDSSSHGAALLHIMHSVAAVVLHYRPEDRTWFELAQSLRAIRHGVPIILLSRDPILCLPFCRLIVSHLTAFAHCAGSQHSCKRNMALLKQDISDIGGKVLAEFLIERSTAHRGSVAFDLNHVAFDTSGLLC